MADNKAASFGALAAANQNAKALVSNDSTPIVPQAPLEHSTFYASRGSPPPSDAVPMGSDRKRGRRSLINDDNTLDDILGQLTSKLNTLLTSEEEKRDELVNAFIDVLGCPKTESFFYLESTNWDLESAVVLWLENNQQGVSRYSYNDYQPARPSTVDLADLSGVHHTSGLHKKYRPITVKIEGLPLDWSAIVNANNGIIQFRHIPTGFVQSNVPPGFADLRDDEDDIDVDSWGMPKLESPVDLISPVGGLDPEEVDDEDASNACVDGFDEDDLSRDKTSTDPASRRSHIPPTKFKKWYGIGSSERERHSQERENYSYAVNGNHSSDYANVFSLSDEMGMTVATDEIDSVNEETQGNGSDA